MRALFTVQPSTIFTRSFPSPGHSLRPGTRWLSAPPLRSAVRSKASASPTSMRASARKTDVRNPQGSTRRNLCGRACKSSWHLRISSHGANRTF
jgi:hypothetical protein